MLEIGLALWLFSGVRRFAAWAAAVATFSAFAIIAYSRIRAGHADCGCFGRAPVPPLTTFLLDGVMVAALIASRPPWEGWSRPSAAFGGVLRAAGVAAALVAAAAGFAHFRYGSVHAGVAAAAGRSVALVEPVVDLGSVPAGALVDGELHVVNLSDAELQIAYVTMPCRCAAFRDLPATVPAGKSGALAFVLQVPRTSGPFRRGGRVMSSAGEADFTLVGTATAGK